MMKFAITALRSTALLLPLTLLAACGGTNSGSNSGSNPITQPPPVSAATTYSDSALSGTYSIALNLAVPEPQTTTYIGTAVLDGNGNMTAITLSEYDTSGSPNSGACQFTGNGFYTVNTDASGTAGITLTKSICSGNTTILPIEVKRFTLQAAQEGASFLLMGTGTNVGTGTGLKQ